MSAVCGVLEIDPNDIPEPPALCKAFDRFKMWV